jgi:hypothetical protein
MTHLAEGLPFTEYEDCGFRYVTFIVDLTKAQKDAWRPFSADGENDAFIWFPLDEVKAGRPLPDEYGDLHDIHFGVNFTMQNMPKKANPRRRNPRRRNPIRFIAEYTPKKAQALKDSRAVRSMLSPALQQKSVARMVDSPHNFVVVIRDATSIRRGKPPVFSDAVTLIVGLHDVSELDKDLEKGSRQLRESLYTAFTYLHRLGDRVADSLLGPSGDFLLDPEARPDDPIYASFYQMVDEHLAWLEQDGKAFDREDALANYIQMIFLSVNSKMVREGYADGWDQAFADLFPLCELTPPTRPLLLPVTDRKIPPRIVGVFNDYIVPDFNASFRAFYNLLIPHLYGSEQWI